jgi:hypothetical protein
LHAELQQLAKTSTEERLAAADSCAFSLLHSHFFALYALSRFTFVVLLAMVLSLYKYSRHMKILNKLEDFLRIATAVAGATYNTNYSCKYILYLSKSDTIHVANDSAI